MGILRRAKAETFVQACAATRVVAGRQASFEPLCDIAQSRIPGFLRTDQRVATEPLPRSSLVRSGGILNRICHASVEKREMGRLEGQRVGWSDGRICTLGIPNVFFSLGAHSSQFSSICERSAKCTVFEFDRINLAMPVASDGTYFHVRPVPFFSDFLFSRGR